MIKKIALTIVVIIIAYSIGLFILHLRGKIEYEKELYRLNIEKVKLEIKILDNNLQTQTNEKA